MVEKGKKVVTEKKAGENRIRKSYRMEPHPVFKPTRTQERFAVTEKASKRNIGNIVFDFLFVSNVPWYSFNISKITANGVSYMAMSRVVPDTPPVLCHVFILNHL